jgi:hypothetical protein
MVVLMDFHWAANSAVVRVKPLVVEMAGLLVAQKGILKETVMADELVETMVFQSVEEMG